MLVTPTETKDGGRFLDYIGAAITQFKHQTADQQVNLAGVGIGVPGFVFANGVVDSTYGFLEFMEDYPLADHIRQQHDLPCLLDNDARVVPLGEAIYGRGKRLGRVLVLTLGTGLGLGFTINGKLDGSLPFVNMGGHITISDDKTVCYCGKTGCLESLVSASGICRIASRLGWSANYPDLPLTAEILFAQRKAGNPVAETVIQEYIGYLQIGIANYVNLYAPDLIMLGGGIAKGLANDVGKLYNAGLLNPYKAYKTTIAISALEEQAGILGSAALFR